MPDLDAIRGREIAVCLDEVRRALREAWHIGGYGKVSDGDDMRAFISEDQRNELLVVIPKLVERALAKATECAQEAERYAYEQEIEGYRAALATAEERLAYLRERNAVHNTTENVLRRQVKDAEAARRRFERWSETPMRVYGCPECGGFHLTSKVYRRRDGQEDGEA